LFGKKAENDNDNDTTVIRSKEKDEDRGIRTFFKKLFGKKPE
jgi:hypothetical protein